MTLTHLHHKNGLHSFDRKTVASDGSVTVTNNRSTGMTLEASFSDSYTVRTRRLLIGSTAWWYDLSLHPRWCYEDTDG